MSDNAMVVLLEVCLVLVVIVMFAPGRKALGSLFSQAWKFLAWGGALALSFIQSTLMHVLRAHLIVLRNLRPRGAVLPTVRKKTIRRE